MAGGATNYYSAVIYKKQLPSDSKHIDVVMAIIGQYSETIVDCVQPINGLYKIDLTHKKAHLDLLTKGLKWGDRTIPVTKWIEGMDSPQVRLVIKGLPKDYQSEPIIEALVKAGLQVTSTVDNEMWKNPNTGRDLGVRSGNKVVFIKKTDTPIPSTLQVADKEAVIWYWGQRLAPKTIFGEKAGFAQTEKPESDKVPSNQLSQSLFSQDNIQETSLIDPTPGTGNNEIKKPHVPVHRRPRSTSRRGGPSKRSLSSSRVESPSKTPKHPSWPNAETHSTEPNPTHTTPVEAAGQGSGAPI